MKKQTGLLLAITASCIFIFGSCKKKAEEIVSNYNVSGKIKRTISTEILSKKVAIKTFEYDQNNRLTKLNMWTEDRSNNRVVTSNRIYSTFSYDGLNQFPTKNSLVRDWGYDSTLYYYDTYNRVVEEVYYKEGVNTSKSTYSYLSPEIVLRKYYLQGLVVLELQSTDSLIYNSQNILQEVRHYRNDLGGSSYYDGNSTFEYDNKKNPLFGINIFSFIYSLTFNVNNSFINDRSPYNSVKLNIRYNTIEYTFNYSLNSFPLSASTIYGTITYEYY